MKPSPVKMGRNNVQSLKLLCNPEKKKKVFSALITEILVHRNSIVLNVFW